MNKPQPNNKNNTTPATIVVQTQQQSPPRKNRNRRQRQRRARANNAQLGGTPLLSSSAVGPSLVSGIRSGSTRGGIRIQGTEMLTSVANGSDPAKFLVQNFFLSSQDLSRLKCFGMAYEKYKFHRAILEYVPIVSALEAGAVSLWLDYDIGDDAEPAQNLAARNTSYALGRVSERLRVLLDGKLGLPSYTCINSALTNPFKVQAIVRFATEGVAGIKPAAVIGYVNVTYDVEFYTPC